MQNSRKQTNTTWAPLPRAEVIKALERRGPARIPLVMAKWWGEGLVDQYGERLDALDRYPDDAEIIWIPLLTSVDAMLGVMNLSWTVGRQGSSAAAHDAGSIVTDWAQLDEFIEKLPDAESDPTFDALIAQARSARARGRYVLFGWWNLFFERPWYIRSMQGLLMDYYVAPDEIHRLHDALCDMYCGYIRRAARDLDPDGFWTSDDLGTQRQLFMRPDTFREFIKPYYGRVGSVLRTLGLHWWLHSCGNNTDVLPDLIEAGVDVFHPVQKGTMDEVAVAQEYGEELTFLVGIDVQHTLQEKGPDGVRDEVRFLVDTFDRRDGGMCIAAGNGIVAGTPYENIEAFLDEALRYGFVHRQQWS